MGVLKNTTNLITNWFDNSDAINEVTKGDVNEIDISTLTNFPLAHIIYGNANYLDGYSTLTYNIQLLDTFFENKDDKLDVLDAMNELATQFVSACNKGSIFNSQVRVFTTPTGTVVYDQLKNRLYGVSLSITLQIPNGLTNCG